MAKDGTNCGGARPGAGRKKKALTEKITEGRDTQVLTLPKPANLKGADVPPVQEYMKAKQKDGTDLGKCGVYKYTEDPDFEVLLFGYAVDGGEIHVVDLALGEKIPADIAASLTDENVLKFAFNSSFSPA